MLRRATFTSPRLRCWTRGGTADHQMVSVCNSAPLFLLARTPGWGEGGVGVGVGWGVNALQNVKDHLGISIKSLCMFADGRNMRHG